MAKAKPVEIVVVVDRSGSMESIRDDAIGGFNSFLNEQKAVKGKANLTLVMFDDQYEVVYDSVDIQDVQPMTRETLVPRGSTALNDAIGKSLANLEVKNPKKAIIVILTDGAENSSKEWTGAKVKEKVEAAQTKGWEIVFLAANIDAAATAGTYGMAQGSARGFAPNAAGVLNASLVMTQSVTSYRSN